MKNFLRKILGIQTWKLVVFNPQSTRTEDLEDGLKGFPVIYVRSHAVDAVKVVDTGVIAKKIN